MSITTILVAIICFGVGNLLGYFKGWNDGWDERKNTWR